MVRTDDEFADDSRGRGLVFQLRRRVGAVPDQQGVQPGARAVWPDVSVDGGDYILGGPETAQTPPAPAAFRSSEQDQVGMSLPELDNPLLLIPIAIARR